MTHDLLIRTGRDEAGRLRFTDVQPIRSHPRRPSGSFSWDNVSDQELTRLARDHSAQQIATMLGCSRNAVIGRCYRKKIGLASAATKGQRTVASSDPRPARKPSILRPPSVPQAARARTAFPGASPAEVASICASRRKQREAAMIATTVDWQPAKSHFLDIQEGFCRWPLWQSAAPFSEKFFCGNEVVPGQSYCSHCLGLSINPQHTRDTDRRLNLKKLARAA